MTQEQKDLLLKDLCARLPYKPIVQIDDCGIWSLRGVDHDDSAELRDRVIVWHGENYPSSKNSFPIINCKPYLFPLSSMTEEHIFEINNILGKDFEIDKYGITDLIRNRRTCLSYLELDALFEYFNKYHFDYRGLIPMGLALDATGKNIY